MSIASIAKNRLARATLIGIVAALLAVLLSLFGTLAGAERGSYDIRARMFSDPRGENEEVLLILVDEASLEWALETQGQSWPWPRAYYGAIVDFARRANVASITFDVLYTDDSFFGVGDDQVFADAAAAQGRTVAAGFYGQATGSHEAFPQWVPLPGATVDVEGVSPGQIRTMQRASFPVPELAQSAARIGNVNLLPDEDGIYRRAPLIYGFDGEIIPTLALAAWMAANEEQARFSLRDSGRTLVFDDVAVPLDRQGNQLVRFDAGAQVRERLRASAIIESELRILQDSDEPPIVDPDELEGRHVMVGFSAAGLFDLRPMPVDGRAPGVEFHAAMLENLLSGRFMREPLQVIELLYVALIAFLTGFAAALARGSITTALSLLLAVVLPVAGGALLYMSGYWFPIVVPATAGLIGSVGAAVLNYATEGKERRFIKGAFSQYLSPAVIERLLADPSRLQLGGERRELTIFFSDLQGFTSLSEGLTPDELTQLLNEYLTEMTDRVTGSGGTVDKYEGDAIIAFWNAPLDVEDHPRIAVEAALSCQERLAEMRPEFRRRVGKDLFMRIGLNTGPAVVGNMGSRSRFDYSMLGDAVNLAARLEGVNKQFGTYTMISEATASRLPDSIACRELGRIAVVGRSEPVRIFEPMWRHVYDSGLKRFEAFAAALERYYAGAFADARDRFRELHDDPPAQKYVVKCSSLSESPPKEWNGVWIMESK